VHEDFPCVINKVKLDMIVERRQWPIDALILVVVVVVW
jgi:hypothetical protein